MKKTFCILTVLLVMAVLLTGCDQPGRDPNETTGSLPQQTEAPTEQPTEEITTSPNTPVTGSVTGFHTWRYKESGGADAEPFARVISNEAEWTVYRAKYLPDGEFETEYNVAFFENHTLVLLYAKETHSTTELLVSEVQVSDGKLSVEVERTQDMDMLMSGFGYWLIFIEVEGDLLLDEDSDVAITLGEIEYYHSQSGSN